MIREAVTLARGNVAEAARACGLHYLAITDHSKRLALLHGLDADGLARQIDRIDTAPRWTQAQADALNARFAGVPYWDACLA